MPVTVTVVSFLTSLLLTAILIPVAPWLRLVDQPSERKVHTRTTPRGGGLAIAAGVLVGLLVVWSTAFNSETRPYGVVAEEMFVFAGLGLLVVLLGLLDDLFNLPWQFRLMAQTALAAGTVIWVLPIPARGPRLIHFYPEYATIAGILAAIWIVALINAFNMLDNMDALSAGTAWIAAAVFVGLLWEGASKSSQVFLVHLMLLGALTGFLCFNFPPARIFMGDAGSTFLGFFFGVRTLSDGIIRMDTPKTWVVPLCVLAVPLYDQVTVVALRLWQGKSPFHADKQHLSHRLVALGLSQPAAVGVILLFGVVSGAAGIAIARLEEAMAWVVFGGLVFGWLVVALVEYAPHLQKRNPGEPGSHAPGCERSHLRG